MTERSKEYTMGYKIAEKKRKGEINESQELMLIRKATLIIIQEGLIHSIFIRGFTDGLKGKLDSTSQA